MNMLAGIFLIVWRSLRQHALSTVVTVLSVALASALVMAVFSIKEQTHRAFTSGATGFDAVLGARGSELQLVLNSVFHLETSPGNIRWLQYSAIKRDPRVKVAIPYAVGDNYHGYRIVGTTPDFFEQYRYGDDEALQVRPGERVFDPQAWEAVIGHMVARRTGLAYGDDFHSYHGLGFRQDQEHADVFKVVGVLKPTGTPIDRVIWVPIDAYYHMQGHALRREDGAPYQGAAGTPIPDEYKEVSAVMLKLKDPATGQRLYRDVNVQGKVMTLAWPIGKVMADLFNKIGWANRVLALVAYLVMFVAAGSILASIYNTMNERRREFAILRALGARRMTVFSAIVLEAGAIAAMGAVLGYAGYVALLMAAAAVIRSQTGVVLDVARFHPVLVLGPLGMMALGALAGVVPAVKAYATDVASNLNPTS